MFINSFPGAQTGQRSRRNGIIDGKFDRGEDYNWWVIVIQYSYHLGENDLCVCVCVCVCVVQARSFCLQKTPGQTDYINQFQFSSLTIYFFASMI